MKNTDDYTSLQPSNLVARNPLSFALEFGSDDPVREMIALGAMNAICQHVMRETDFEVESAPDPLGLLSVAAEDRIGMVGLFVGLTKAIKKAGAELVVIEKKEKLIDKFPDLPITTDPSQLGTCNKVLCTGTTLLNNSLDEILSHCSPEAFISIIGPTAGYFPDPLFARGVDVVGGRVVTNGEVFLQRLEERKRWGRRHADDLLQERNLPRPTLTTTDYPKHEGSCGQVIQDLLPGRFHSHRGQPAAPSSGDLTRNQ